MIPRMKMGRWRKPPANAPEFYHCHCRLHEIARPFIAGGKARFVEILNRQAAFSGVEVLTYSLLDDRFHLLCHVPKPPSQFPTGGELLRRFVALFPEARAKAIVRRWECLPEAERPAWEAMIHRRMWNIGLFMKDVKQRYSEWNNRKTGNEGGSWNQRYHCEWVDSSTPVLWTTAAFIDLAPLRAGLVTDPKAHRWGAFGAAVAGCPAARAGFGRIVASFGPPGGEEPFEVYCRWLNGVRALMGTPVPQPSPMPLVPGLN